MKRMTMTAALALALALSAGASAVYAKTKRSKPSAEHVAAIKKCDEDYKGALKEAKMKKGAERKTAEQSARATRKQCVASAPK